MKRTRQLAAIMFTDIEGYSAMMQQNEEKAIQVRSKHRKIFNSTTESHNGKILQYYGDGTLSIFDSAIDAVKCGIEMQLSFMEEPNIPVRIGIHLGDIVISEEEIIGDGVNVASRIESLAVPGSVFISDKVYDEIKNQESLKTSLLKTFMLKNIERPTEVYAISNEGLIVPNTDDIKGKTEADPVSSSIKQEQPILATKLYIPPPRPKAVLRSRLLEQLNMGMNHKLILLCAPAGFGKTTLASEWVAGCDRPTAWLSLDEGDNDSTGFLSYLVAALRTITPNIGAGVLNAMQSPQPSSSESLLTALLNEISAFPDDFNLVLDDYHLIDVKPANDLLSFLLEHMPPQMHVIITTREDPRLPLARFRARSQLTELRIKDLRFTPSEAAEFLNQVMGLNLSTDNIARLEENTEGWVAGLQMAALSMQGRDDVSGFIKAFTGDDRHIVDYLVEEVLLSQPEHVRSFLLETSILDRLSGTICDAVTGKKDGKRMLEELERGNLFVFPLDDKRQWYRYHHLFAGVLKTRLMEEQPERILALHRQASEWYEQNGLLADAIRHALAAEDFEWAAGLIETVWPETNRYIQSAPWLGWVKVLPEELVRVRPVLNINYACALMDIGEMEAGEARLQQVEELLKTTEDISEIADASNSMVVVDKEQFRLIPATIASARAYLAGTLGDVAATIKYTKQNIDLLPEDDHYGREGATAMLGIAYITNGDLEAAYQTFEGSFEGMQKAGDIDDVGGTFLLADIRIAQGRLSDAICLYERSLELIPKQGPVPSGTAYLYLGLSKLYHEQGKPIIAEEYLLRGEEANKNSPYQLWQYRFILAQAQVAEDQGNLDGALELLNKAEALYYRNIIPEIRPLEALKVQIWIKQGKLNKVVDWVQMRGLTVDDDLSYTQEFEHLTLARVLITQFKREPSESYILKALGLLGRLLKAAEEGKRGGSVIDILILQALAHEAQDNIPHGLRPLERALTLAEPEGYLRTFVIEGKPMVQLLSAAIANKIMPYYISKLLAVFEDEKQKQVIK
jgi:LuxR family maltose regulon positive regulatory protein